jgi:hypothetical protein
MGSGSNHDGPFYFSHMAVQGSEGEVRGPDREEQLPWRKCDDCGQKEWHFQLARYGLGIPRTLDRKLFTSYHALSLEEFDVMLQHFPVTDEVRRTLLPGTRIGNPSYELITAPYDFVSEVSMFVSERTLDGVRARGVQVDAVPVNVISSRKRPIPNYYYIIPRIAAIMDPEWLKIEKVQCWRCGNWWLKPDLRLPKIVLDCNGRVMRSRWPDRSGVVYSSDICARTTLRSLWKRAPTPS